MNARTLSQFREMPEVMIMGGRLAIASQGRDRSMGFEFCGPLAATSQKKNCGLRLVSQKPNEKGIIARLYWLLVRFSIGILHLEHLVSLG